jgi:hypothetical protein
MPEKLPKNITRTDHRISAIKSVGFFASDASGMVMGDGC